MHDPSRCLSPASCHAARRLLKISEEELAELACVSVSTVRRFETGQSELNAFARRRIYSALGKHGVLFLRGGRTPIAF